MKWTDSCDTLVDFVEEHGGSMGGETRDHLFNIVQNILDGQPVEPVPADSEMNLRREILDVLAANHTSAYDLRNDLYAIFQGVEPVPAPSKLGGTQ
jgi:hypothetical protein